MITKLPSLGKLLAPFLAALLLTVACQGQPETISSPESNDAPVSLNGAGASFPLFLYERWFREYNQLHPNVQVNYQPVGSAAGIQQVINGTVDFGASDVAMTDEEIAQVDRGVVMLPMTAGSVAIAYNLPSVESGLRLSREVLSEIFLGQISQWNDPKIVELNPDLTIPEASVTVVHHSDGSRTTALFTSHLAAISPEWEEEVGSGLNVQWPTGVGVKSVEEISS